MHNTINISHQLDFNYKSISLPASKSVANRALIIDALGGGNSTLANMSSARDTQTMLRLLKSDNNVLDVIDAGTTMRFLTAYLAVTNQNKILTGSERMRNRPIGILVDALRQLGANISYLEKEGYPPLHLQNFTDVGLNKLAVQGNISSQYISALLMIAPLLKNGLEINLTGKVGSKPYIKMTLAVMKAFGVNGTFHDHLVKINNGQYKTINYQIEPDWSAASYWYSLVALSHNSSILIKDLKPIAIQGDSVIVDIMRQLGVGTTFNEEGAILSKIPHQKSFEFDFTDCPDLAQTIAVICAAKNINVLFTGLESLRIKETDRIAALQNELAKIGAKLVEKQSHWHLHPSLKLPNQANFCTYEDHRMAMAFAPLALLMSVTIEEPKVVEKSYPEYWEHYKTVGFNCKFN